MTEETKLGKSLPIIKNDVFDLTEKDVNRMLKETKIEFEATKKSLDEDNLAEREGVFRRTSYKC